jgi:outer membrane protein OmpA-like peptidoglycan-associated protein
MTPLSKKLSWVAAVGLLVSGCAETPKELVDARAAYKRASTGPAAKSNPVQVAEAKKSLDEAEDACNSCMSNTAGADKAYVALRNAERAESLGRTAQLGADLNAANTQLASVQGEYIQRGLGRLAAASAASAAAVGALGKSQAELDAERAAAEAAQRRAQAALDKIRGKLTVTDRGTIITLPGALLFPTGKSALSPAGRRNLVPLMDFLRTDGRKIEVDGYTDSTGSLATNMKLSQARADTVMADIIKDGGIPADRISAVGKGPDNPIGDNKTAAGRELNRRVEILLLNPPK